MALRSGHCCIPTGLASMDGPLLVLSVESQLCECPFVVLPRQLVGSGVCSPASPICPTSSVLKRSSFGISASVFASSVREGGSPFRVEPVSVLDRNEDSSSAFLVFGWSLRDGVTLSGRVCLSPRSERRLFLHLPGGWRQAFTMGSPVSGRVALFCALDRNAGFFRSSILRCFAMGSPYGSCVFFSHSIVTKSTLDS